MRFHISLLLVPATFAFLNCNQTEPAQSGTDRKTGLQQPNSHDYAEEIIHLKSLGLKDEERSYSEIQTKFGFSAVPEAGNNGIPMEAPDLKKDMGLAKNAAAAGYMTWVEKFTTSAYPLKKVFYKQVYLNAGFEYLMTTHSGAATVDPVMVVFQYDDDNWKATGNLVNRAQPSLTVLGFSDDYIGLNPRVITRAYVSGYYAVLVYSYSTGSQGTVTFEEGTSCSGQPPGGYCIVGTPIKTTIPVAGVNVNVNNYYSGYLGGFKLTSTGGGDPKLYVFDYTALRGVYNDDTSENPSLNSFAWNFGFAFQSGNTKRAIVGGFYDGGNGILTGLEGTFHP